MKRIKLGIAACALVALLIVPASAAASGGIVADDYPATLQGDGELVMVVTSTTSCILQPFSSSLNGPATSFAGKSDCGTEKLKMNGCQFEFHPGSKSFDIGPTGCGPVTSNYCKNMTIPPQQGLAAQFENIGSGSSARVKIKPEANVTYTLPEFAFGCGAAGTHKFYLGGFIEVDAVDAGSAPVGIRTVPSGDLPVGMSVVQTGFGEELVERFDAQVFPVDAKGQKSSSGNLLLYGSNGQAKCETVSLDGGEVATQTAEIAYGATFGGCDVFGFKATVDMNTCSYVLSVESDAAEVECSTPGDAIEVISATSCSIKLAPQVVGAVKYTNQGSGSSATIGAQVTGSKVQITKEGPLCFLFKSNQGTTDLGLDLFGTR